MRQVSSGGQNQSVKGKREIETIVLKNGCVFLVLGTESCSKLSILIGAKWTRHKEGRSSTNLQIIFWQVS